MRYSANGIKSTVSRPKAAYPITECENLVIPSLTMRAAAESTPTAMLPRTSKPFSRKHVDKLLFDRFAVTFKFFQLLQSPRSRCSCSLRPTRHRPLDHCQHLYAILPRQVSGAALVAIHNANVDPVRIRPDRQYRLADRMPRQKLLDRDHQLVGPFLKFLEMLLVPAGDAICPKAVDRQSQLRFSVAQQHGDKAFARFGNELESANHYPGKQDDHGEPENLKSRLKSQRCAHATENGPRQPALLFELQVHRGQQRIGVN